MDAPSASTGCLSPRSSPSPHWPHSPMPCAAPDVGRGVWLTESPSCSWPRSLGCRRHLLEETEETFVAVRTAVLVGLAPRLVLPAAWLLRRQADALTIDATAARPPGSAVAPAPSTRRNILWGCRTDHWPKGLHRRRRADVPRADHWTVAALATQEFRELDRMDRVVHVALSERGAFRGRGPSSPDREDDVHDPVVRLAPPPGRRANERRVVPPTLGAGATGAGTPGLPARAWAGALRPCPSRGRARRGGTGGATATQEAFDDLCNYTTAPRRGPDQWLPRGNAHAHVAAAVSVLTWGDTPAVDARTPWSSQ
jgi:hypothetical protein